MAQNLRPPEVNAAFEPAPPAIVTGKMAPATGSEQLAQTIQATLDLPK